MALNLLEHIVTIRETALIEKSDEIVRLCDVALASQGLSVSQAEGQTVTIVSADETTTSTLDEDE